MGRVIARPFAGDAANNYARTGNRRDYSVLPPAPTLLDKLTERQGTVVSIGKIADIYAHQGISKAVKANGLAALVDKTIAEYQAAGDNTLIFTNLVDFDQNYGHRRDPIGYGEALEYFDTRLPELTAMLADGSVLLMTADHGCDPTWIGTEHTREYVPVLFCGPQVKPVDLGERATFADMGQTLADYFGLDALAYGESFLAQTR
ncbi:MAG: phosphopentomutase [Rheinheimera sp.]|nr:phosphopentomutase [Rheinheimera sp.]